MKWRNQALLISLALAGGAALAAQILWQRLVLPLVGSEFHATLLVILAFFGGISAGSYLSGRTADAWDRRRALWKYAVFQLAAGAYILLLPVLIQILAQGAPRGFLLLSLVLALGVPAGFIGAGVPVLARYWMQLPQRRGDEVAQLYGFGMLGAVVGCLACVFFSLALLGVTGAVFLTALGHVIAAALGWGSLPESQRSVPPPSPGVRRRRRVAHVMRTSARLAPLAQQRRTLGLAVLALIGGTALVYQVSWVRFLSFYAGGSIYTLSFGLSAFLLGIGLGILAVLRFPGVSRGDRLRLLAVSQLSVGAVACTTLYLCGLLPVFDYLFGRVIGGEFYPTVGWMLVVTTVILLPTAFFMGAGIPLALDAATTGRRHMGRDAAAFTVMGALGAVGGALVLGVAIVPAVGGRLGVILAIAVNLSVGVVLWNWRSARRHSFGMRAAAVTALPCLTLIVAYLAPWDPLLFTRDLHQSSFQTANPSWASFRQDLHSRYDVRYYREGSAQTVSVIDERDGSDRYLVRNGRIIGAAKSRLESEVLAGQLPFMLHTEAREVLVVGLGTGILSSSVATHAVQGIDILEPEQAAVEASQFFTLHNRNVLADHRVHLVREDLRGYLRAQADVYDVIISGPQDLWSYPSGALLTYESLAAGRAALKSGGVFCQWIPLDGLDPADLKLLTRTFGEVFPHTQVWELAHGVDVLLLGSDVPVEFDVEKVRGQFKRTQLRQDLARIGVDSLYDLLSCFVLGEEGLRQYAGAGDFHTDDDLILEFRSPDATHQPTARLNASLLSSLPSDPYKVVKESTSDLRHRLAGRLRLFDAYKRRELIQKARDLVAPLSREEIIQFCLKDPDLADTTALWGRLYDASRWCLQGYMDDTGWMAAAYDAPRDLYLSTGTLADQLEGSLRMGLLAAFTSNYDLEKLFQYKLGLHLRQAYHDYTLEGADFDGNLQLGYLGGPDQGGQLGPTALGVLGIIQLREPRLYQGQLEKLVGFMGLLQEEDGRWGSGVFKSDPEEASLLQVGYALSAFMELYYFTGHDIFLKRVETSFPFLAEYAGQIEDLETAYWLIQSLHQAYRATGEEAYADWVVRSADRLVPLQSASLGEGWEIFGGVGPHGSTADTGIFSLSMGEASALAEEAGFPDRAQLYRQVMELGVRYLLQQQVVEEEALEWPNPVRSMGGVREFAGDGRMSFLGTVRASHSLVVQLLFLNEGGVRSTTPSAFFKLSQKN